MGYENKEPDIFDEIIIETDTLFMRIRMLFAEHVVRSIGITGTDVEKLDITIPLEAGGLFQLIKINRISVDNENEHLYLETPENRKIRWDEISIHSQQIVVDTLHHAVRVCMALQKSSESCRIN